MSTVPKNEMFIRILRFVAKKISRGACPECSRRARSDIHGTGSLNYYNRLSIDSE